MSVKKLLIGALISLAQLHPLRTHNYSMHSPHLLLTLGAQILLSRFSFFFLGDFGSADDSLAENLPDRAEALGALET